MTDSEEAPQWPPRAPEAPPPESAVLRELQGADAEPLALTLDESIVPEECHEFQPGRLAQEAISGPRRSAIGPAPTPGGPPRALVFDPKNPSGRTRYDAIFDARDEDFRVRMRKLCLEAAMAGASLPVLVFVTLGHASLLWWMAGVIVGALGGISARAAGDSPMTWAAIMALVGVVISFVYPLAISQFTVPAALMAGGWIIGLTREAGR